MAWQVKGRPTRKQLALIHILKVQVGMDDDEYRAFLSRFGVLSSAELKPSQFDEAVRLMKAWSGKAEDGGLRTDGGGRMTEDGKSPLVGKIGALLKEMELPWSYADGIAMNMFRVRKVKWCSAGELRKVVAALVYHQKRTADDGKSEGGSDGNHDG